MISINFVYAVKWVPVIPLCSLALEMEICQSSGMRALSKPLGEMSTYSASVCFLYLYFLFPGVFLLPANARKFLGKMQHSGNMKFINLKKLDSLR